MAIEFTNVDQLFAREPICEETTGMVGNEYTRCGRPASGVVLSERGKRLYFMCRGCFSHNVNNRGAVAIAEKE